MPDDLRGGGYVTWERELTGAEREAILHVFDTSAGFVFDGKGDYLKLTERTRSDARFTRLPVDGDAGEPV